MQITWNSVKPFKQRPGLSTLLGAAFQVTYHCLSWPFGSCLQKTGLFPQTLESANTHFYFYKVWSLVSLLHSSPRNEILIRHRARISTEPGQLSGPTGQNTQGCNSGEQQLGTREAACFTVPAADGRAQENFPMGTHPAPGWRAREHGVFVAVSALHPSAGNRALHGVVFLSPSSEWWKITAETMKFTELRKVLIP